MYNNFPAGRGSNLSSLNGRTSRHRICTESNVWRNSNKIRQHHREFTKTFRLTKGCSLNIPANWYRWIAAQIIAKSLVSLELVTVLDTKLYRNSSKFHIVMKVQLETFTTEPMIILVRVIFVSLLSTQECLLTNGRGAVAKEEDSKGDCSAHKQANQRHKGDAGNMEGGLCE